MKRKTIGVLVGGITDDFTRLLCHGVIERAKTLDVNIVVIPGKFLDREYPETSDIYYEYQYQTLFSYATKENLDGVIVASSCIGCFATKERISEFTIKPVCGVHSSTSMGYYNKLCVFRQLL